MTATTTATEITYYSGYIRNRRALCRELGIAAELGRDEAEREALIRAYEKWGMDMLDHLYGAYAFAIKDNKSGRTIVARDHVGQKQMFYSVIGGELVCSGDIDAIASDSRFDKRLNKRMLALYLFYGYPIGEETFYEGIYKLKAGHYLVWDGKNAEIVRYFCPLFKPEKDKSVDFFADEIKKVVADIFADESGDPAFPYKESFLSGGVDSSYLLAAGDAAKANTVGYAESGFDESALAQRTADILGKELGIKTISAEEFFARIESTVDGLGQPLADASAVAFSIGCASAREHARVVYSGEGIDEFFGGYNAHKREIPESWTYLTCSHIMSEDFVRSLMKDCGDDFDPARPISKMWDELKGYEPLSKKLTVDISFWLEGDIYLNTDRTSTACGVELHTPFSDQRLLKTALRVPPEYLFMNDQNKYVFRKAASSKLPDEVAFRKKVGFPVPVREWLADSRYNKPVEEKLFGRTAEMFFDTDILRDMWTRFIGGEALLWNRIYAIYAFILWYDIKFGN